MHLKGEEDEVQKQKTIYGNYTGRRVYDGNDGWMWLHAIYSSKKGTKVSDMCSVVTESESGQNLSNFAPDKIAPGTERVVYFVMEVDKKVKAKDLKFIITFDNMVYQLSAK